MLIVINSWKNQYYFLCHFLGKLSVVPVTKKENIESNSVCEWYIVSTSGGVSGEVSIRLTFILDFFLCFMKYYLLYG